MNSNIYNEFDICNGDVISIVGAGGKTTLMYKLANDISLGKKLSVVVSTTTKIFPPKKDVCKSLIIEKFNFTKELYGSFVTWGRKIINGKIISSTEDDIAKLKSKFDIVILEADGAKEKIIKAYKEYEPCVSTLSSKVIAVIDIKSIGEEICDKNVHNIELFLKLTNKNIGDIIDFDDYIKLIGNPNCFFKGFEGDKYIYLSKVSEKYLDIAKEFKSKIEKIFNIKVVIGEYIGKSISAIILGAGYSSRMGIINKLLLPYKGIPIIERTINTLYRCEDITEIILVTNKEIIKKINVLENVKVVYNEHPELGISESIKMGINNSKGNNFMFLVGDEPKLTNTFLDTLIDRFDNKKITLPVQYGEFKNPVIFPIKYKKQLLELNGDVGGKKIIKEELENTIFVQITDEVDLEDVDTMEEYIKKIREDIVVVRGGGDIATGTIQKLFRAGFNVIVTEIERPSAIRRSVSTCESIYEGSIKIEDIEAISVEREIEEILKAWQNKKIPVIVDPDCRIIKKIKPIAVVDAILAKKNCGTIIDMAPITIALGPGFEAGVDVDCVIETYRGHNLGRLIFSGKAEANTGIPGAINGFTKERVMHAEGSGIIKNICKIGDIVKKDEVVAEIVGDEIYLVKAKIDGILRGIIRDGYKVEKGLKIADVDSRMSELDNCFTISDKARNIGGGVLEALIYMKNKI